MPVTQPILVEQTQVGVKSETSYGTLATLAAGDFLYVSKFDVKVDAKAVQREYRQASLNALADAIGDVVVNVSMEGEYMVSGAAGVVFAPMSAIELAAGMKLSTSTYIQEHTASANFPCPGTSATIEGYFRNVYTRVKGVYGNYVETYASDDLVRWKFDGKGLFVTMSGSYPAAATFPSNYIPVTSASFQIHSYDAEVSKVEIDYGNTVEAIGYVGTNYGVSKVMITKRRPVVKFDALMDTVATHDFIGRMVDKSSGALALKSGGSRTITYAAAACTYRAVDIADRNGVMVYNVEAPIAGTFTKVIA